MAKNSCKFSLYVIMHRRFKQAFCVLKEHSYVSYAKVLTFGGCRDLYSIIVKATSPDDFPLPEKYIHELLKIFSISPSSFHSFSLSFTRRFGRTHCWKVALKCLLLLHRLLRSLPEHSPFRTELLWARSNGFLSLYPCNFSDDSSSNPDNYTHFIRSYAQLLDEAIDCFSLEKKTKEEEEEKDEEEEMSPGLQDKMKDAHKVLDFLPQLQSLIDKVMDCRPMGVASKSFIIQSAMQQIIRDSCVCYTTFRKEIVLVLDNLIQMPYRSCILSFGIYKKAASQTQQLSEFYDWCKAKGICGSYEYPFIERIPEIQIKALETFLNGMWQLTESSSSSSSSWVESNKSSSIEDEEGDHQTKQNVEKGIVLSTQWVKFDQEHCLFPRKMEKNKEEMMEPLIQLENDGESDNWEILLDLSSIISRNNHMMYFTGFNNNWYEHEKETGEEEENNQWQMQVYNPFNQPCYYTPSCSTGWPASDPAYPWGL